MGTVTDRVSAGAAQLDSLLPGWEWNVVLVTLNLASRCDCIIGQLSGHFSKQGFKELGFIIDDHWDEMPAGFGFDANAVDQVAKLAEYDALQTAWKSAVLERRAG